MCKHLAILFLIFTFFFRQEIKAQDLQSDCLKQLEKAEKLYEQGEIDEIPKILSPCMENGFTRNQRIAAYKLIILTYLFDDDQYEAEKTMLDFLRKYPEYETMPSDPVEFVYLFQSFRTTSIFTLNFHFGPNFANPRIIEPYTSGDLSNTTSYNKTGTGFQYGFGISKHIAKHLVLNTDFVFTTNNYSFIDNVNYYFNDEKIQLAKISFKETQKRMDVPITLAYELPQPKLDYYAKAGICISKLNSSKGTPERQISEENVITGPDITVTTYRKPVDYFAVISIGTKAKVPRGNLFLEFTTYLGLNNMVNKENRYSNTELISKYFYVDDDFALNSFSLTAGYQFSFFKPKKLK